MTFAFPARQPMDDNMGCRYAIYLAPPVHHPLWARGCEWLGRDPDSLGAPPPPRVPWVSEPWRYGFHLTLKAPFRLRPGVRESDLHTGVTALAERHAVFTMPALRVGWHGETLALRLRVQAAPASALRALAEDAVRCAEPLRAPLTEAEHARRVATGLDQVGLRHLAEYGYPYVLERWVPHLTLTDNLGPYELGTCVDIKRAAQRHFAAALSQAWRCQSVDVFRQDAPGVPFIRTESFALARH